MVPTVALISWSPLIGNGLSLSLSLMLLTHLKSTARMFFRVSLSLGLSELD